MLLTTHYMFEADELCDRIAVIRERRDRRRRHAGRAQAAGHRRPACVEVETFGVGRGRRSPRSAALPGVRVGRRSRSAARLRSCSCSVDAGCGGHPARSSSGSSGVRVGRVASREPTLEDAYVELVSATCSRRRRPSGSSWRLLLVAAPDALDRRAFDGFALASLFPLIFATVDASSSTASADDPAAHACTPVSGARVMGMWTVRSVHRLLACCSASAGPARSSCSSPRPCRSRWCSCRSRCRSRPSALYCVVATLLCERFVFGIDPARSPSWPLFVVSRADVGRHARALRLLPVGHRRCATARAWALGAALEYPGWLLVRVRRPAVACCPTGSSPLSWVLAADLGHGCHPRLRRRRAAPGGDLAVCLVAGRRRTASSAAFLGGRARRLGPSQRDAGPDLTPTMTSLRVFFIGGLISYRGPVPLAQPVDPSSRRFSSRRSSRCCCSPTSAAAPACGNDEFFLIGNALSYAAIPCLFAMGSTIDGRAPVTDAPADPHLARPAGSRCSSAGRCRCQPPTRFAAAAGRR